MGLSKVSWFVYSLLVSGFELIMPRFSSLLSF